MLISRSNLNDADNSLLNNVANYINLEVNTSRPPASTFIGDPSSLWPLNDLL